jgi:hypothetical protein
MHARGFRQRLQSVERSLRRRFPQIDTTRIVQTVLERSSDQVLQLLCRVQQGSLNAEELTDQDCAALESFIAEVNQECRRQGFASWESAVRWSGIYRGSSIHSARGEQ